MFDDVIIRALTKNGGGRLTYYDDNFGHWEGMDDPNHPDYEANRAFYEQVREESVEKECAGCERKVRLRPDYGYCNSCAEKLERGLEL